MVRKVITLPKFVGIRDINAKYNRYLESRIWACPDAPINPEIELQVRHQTGAHYWKQLHSGGVRDFYCKYCFTIKHFGDGAN